MWRPILVASTLLLASAAFAAEPEELLNAARSGDLAKIEQLLAAGIPVDATDKYGNTALIGAAANGRLAAIELLLARGADPSHEESFYGAGAFDLAMMNDKKEAALLVLRGGAEVRERALAMAVRNRDHEMARAAVEAGPINGSTLEELREQPLLSKQMQALLAQAESRPDPEPPTYSAADLAAFSGSFEGWNSGSVVEVAVVDGRLVLSVDGVEHRLEAWGGKSFESEDGTIGASFFGRAGTIEGIAFSRDGGPPLPMRRSVATVVEGAADRVVSVAEPSRAPTVQWPAFRGRNADGIGDGSDALVEWDVESGEGVLWRAEIPGLGNSSPIVWDDTVIVTTAVAEGIEQTIRTGLTGAGNGIDEFVDHSWRVLAFRKSTGELLWSTDVGSGVPLTRRHFKATQANSTPVTDGEFVVAVFPTAGLACLNMAGEIVWRHDLGGLNAGAFSDPGIEWGFASSPIIYGSTVILQADTHEGPYLAAWDLASGEQVWKVERQVAPSWATPTILRGARGDELVVNGSTIRGYDPATGEELWSLGPNSELVIATPVVGEEVIYVSAGYPPIKPIYALPAGTRGEIAAEPGRQDERLLWSHSPGGAYMPTPLLYRGLFYIVHHNGRIVAYDARTGDAVYKSRFSKGGVFTGSPVAVNGRLYLPTEEGMLYVLEAGPAFRELAVNEFGEPLMATPAVSEGVLYVRTPSQLIAVGEASDAAPGL